MPGSDFYVGVQAIGLEVWIEEAICIEEVKEFSFDAQMIYPPGITVTSVYFLYVVCGGHSYAQIITIEYIGIFCKCKLENAF